MSKDFGEWISSHFAKLKWQNFCNYSSIPLLYKYKCRSVFFLMDMIGWVRSITKPNLLQLGWSKHGGRHLSSKTPDSYFQLNFAWGKIKICKKIEKIFDWSFNNTLVNPNCLKFWTYLGHVQLWFVVFFYIACIFFWPHPPSLEFLVHEGATGRLEHTNNLGNLETGTLSWGPQGTSWY